MLSDGEALILKGKLFQSNRKSEILLKTTKSPGFRFWVFKKKKFTTALY